MADEKQGFLYGVALTGVAAALGFVLWVRPTIKETADELRNCAGSLTQTADDLRDCAGMLREVQQQMPQVSIEFQPSVFGETAQDVSFFVEQTQNNRIISYELSTYLNATFADDGTLTPITALDESVFVTGEGVNMEYKDSDVGFQIGVSPSKKICSGKHDGLVDYIINHAVSSNEPDKRLLCRDADYETNRSAFAEADRIFNEVRGQFFSSE